MGQKCAGQIAGAAALLTLLCILLSYQGDLLGNVEIRQTPSSLPDSTRHFVDSLGSERIANFTEFEDAVPHWGGQFPSPNLSCSYILSTSLTKLSYKDSQETLRPHNQSRWAVFAYRYYHGTAILRAEMMAAAFANMAGWSSLVMDKHPPRFFLSNATIEFCVLTKLVSEALLDWCVRRKAKAIYWDMLDNINEIEEGIMRTKPLERIHPAIDVALTNSEYVARQMRLINPPRSNGSRAGWPRAVHLYHHHSNVGFVTPASRFSVPYLCRVAIPRSAHGPNMGSTEHLLRLACSAATVFEVVELAIRGNITTFRCPNVTTAMIVACNHADETARRHVRPQPPNRTCFQDQDAFHTDPILDLIDVVLIWPKNTKIQAFRSAVPSTRLVHWASHGIPAISWWFYAYMELSADGRYQLNNSKQAPIIANNYTRTPLLKSMLTELGDSAVRSEIRRQGLALAAKYTASKVAQRLLDLHENGWPSA